MPINLRSTTLVDCMLIVQANQWANIIRAYSEWPCLCYGPVYSPCICQDYGGDTEKPTWLYSNYSFISDVGLFCTGPSANFGSHELARKSIKGNRVTYSGTPALKGSQSYPKGFGRAVRKTIQKNAHIIRAKKAELRSKISNTKMVKDPWADANVADIMVHLSK